MMLELLIALLTLGMLWRGAGRVMTRAYRRWPLLAALLVIPLGMSHVVAREGLQQRIALDLWRYWYGPDPVTGKSRRHPKQERFIFGPHHPTGCAAYQGMLAGRRVGKTVALVRKAILLLLLNPGDPEDPVWGGIYGRTRREAEKRIIRPLLAELRAIRRDLELDLAPRWDKQNQEIHFANGTAILIGSYGKNDSLENQRGDTLGWAIVDEIERAFMDADDILAVIGVAISDHRARHSCFVWASSPNGMRGMPLKHHEAFQRGDPRWFLVTAIIRDNPFLRPEQIESIKNGLSKRMWWQEGLGVCLSPSNVVFGEYMNEKHLVKYRWDPSDLTVISIDWGTTKGYMCALKVDESGRWRVARERKVTETTRPRFRAEVTDFIAGCVADDGGRYPALMACDGAVQTECKWLRNAYGHECPVKWLRKDAEQGVSWGLNLISYMLDPARDDGFIRLFVSDELDPTTDPWHMGIRGAFQMYTYHMMRTESGELMATDDPEKRNFADDPIDAVRYALCCGRNMEELHGGQRLPFIDPEIDRMQADAASRRYSRRNAGRESEDD